MTTKTVPSINEARARMTAAAAIMMQENCEIDMFQNGVQSV